MPDSPNSQAPSEALTAIDVQEEERDVQIFKGLCESRLQLLQQQYYLMKDCLNRAMVISDIWWGAHKTDNIDQMALSGTKMIDEVIHFYIGKADTLLKTHEEKFSADEAIRSYLEFCEEALAKAFTPAPGLTISQAYEQKGLAVEMAEVDEIKSLLKTFREHFGRKILLEKAAQDFDIRDLLPSLAGTNQTDTSSWSWLWATSTKDEDKILWVNFPHAKLEETQRKAWNIVKQERASLFETKISYVQEYWKSKIQLDRDQPLLDDDGDKDWAADFTDCAAEQFADFLDEVKLRLMKEYSITNFRFLAPLTEKIVFDEHLFARRLGRCSKKDLKAYAQYRIDRLQADKAHLDNLEFRFEGANASSG